LKAKTASGYIGGLLLPNVNILNLGLIPDDFVNTGSPFDRDHAPQLAGTIVYNTHVDTANGIEKGLYVWDGDKWDLLNCGCEETGTPTPATDADITANGIAICSGLTANLEATSSTVPLPVFKWYDSQTATTALETGASYTTSTLTTTTTYYVSVSGTGYDENATGSRKAVTVTVDPLATDADITANGTTICSGLTASLSASSAVPSPSFKWYATQTSTSVLSSASTYTTPALTTMTKYYVSVSGTGYCENATGTRKEVTVTVGSCPRAITTFVNVMYDFQYQKLEVYDANAATSFEWQVSTASNGTYTPISGANSNEYTIPANFAYTHGLTGNHSIPLYFKCKLTYPSGTVIQTDEDAFEMLFINTTTAGYGEDANGVKYLEISMGSGGQTVTTGSTAKMRITLLNLGQSGFDDFRGNNWTLNNDATDLGDFYQWGRVADEHEHTVWSKNASHINQILPISGWPATSANAFRIAIPWGTNSNFPGSYGQIPDPLSPDYTSAAGDYLGKFLTGGGDWGNNINNTNGSGRWAAYYSTINRTNYGNPAKTANDPCPSGWKVPSCWNFWDSLNGNGDNDPFGYIADWTSTNSTWQWRARSASNTVFGGALITNDAGERVFMPATGHRGSSDGLLASFGSFSLYWTTTYQDQYRAYDLEVGSVSVYTAGYDYKSWGKSIRCVAE
jgi:uncharacterized protein (TIGR02145 family)